MGGQRVLSAHSAFREGAAGSQVPGFRRGNDVQEAEWLRRAQS